MITKEEALEKADAWVNGDVPSAERQEIGMYEFEHGYVVWRAEPEPVPPAVVPETIGGGVGVIDKETGELSYWPPLPPDMIAEQYSAKRRSRE